MACPGAERARKSLGVAARTQPQARWWSLCRPAGSRGRVCVGAASRSAAPGGAEHAAGVLKRVPVHGGARGGPSACVPAHLPPPRVSWGEREPCAPLAPRPACVVKGSGSCNIARNSKAPISSDRLPRGLRREAASQKRPILTRRVSVAPGQGTRTSVTLGACTSRPRLCLGRWAQYIWVLLANGRAPGSHPRSCLHLPCILHLCHARHVPLPCCSGCYCCRHLLVRPSSCAVVRHTSGASSHARFWEDGPEVLRRGELCSLVSGQRLTPSPASLHHGCAPRWQRCL